MERSLFLFNERLKSFRLLHHDSSQGLSHRLLFLQALRICSYETWNRGPAQCWQIHPL